MNHIKGLDRLVQSREYREALQLPNQVVETYQLLAQGEYNRNYFFTHPLDGRKLVLRVNCGSQMYLEHQIEYEYHALELLKTSGRTPEPFYVDGSRRYLEHGILVMSYLPGRSLDYHMDLQAAAACLADIHSVRMPAEHGLLSPGNPLQAILEECEEMVTIYMNSPLAPSHKKEKIRHMLDLGWAKLRQTNLEAPGLCCINTELNSTNFLINGEGQDYLVDWEKPLYGDPAQDLGHFLAPTTTFWKTDVILQPEAVRQFLADYREAAAGRMDVTGIEERTMTYIPITCLRGITWCAMAWIQYQEPGKLLFNQSTFDKLEAYLSDAYLDEIEKNFFAGTT